jgi:hypothetical protein
MPVLLLVVLIVLFVIVMTPALLVQRYRIGTARRQARGWIATFNIVAIGLSALLMLVGASISNIWVPHTLRYAVFGLIGGAALGLLGLLFSRWETHTAALHYTPNRWLVLLVMAVVIGRVLYGFWRAWYVWHATGGHTTSVIATGAAESLAAGAVVLGYYFTYWTGVRWRFNRHRRRWGVLQPHDIWRDLASRLR